MNLLVRSPLEFIFRHKVEAALRQFERPNELFNAVHYAREVEREVVAPTIGIIYSKNNWTKNQLAFETVRAYYVGLMKAAFIFEATSNVVTHVLQEQHPEIPMSTPAEIQTVLKENRPEIVRVAEGYLQEESEATFQPILTILRLYLIQAARGRMTSGADKQQLPLEEFGIAVRAGVSDFMGYYRGGATDLGRTLLILISHRFKQEIGIA